MNRSNIIKGLSISVVLFIWVGLSIVFDNDMIVPNMFGVLAYMIHQVMSSTFYMSISVTLLRLVIAFSMSLLVGVLLGILSCIKKDVKDFLSPIVTMIKTIPNISYMIVVLLWFNTHISIVIIVFLILFPMFYTSTIDGIASLRKSLHDVLMLYSETPVNKLVKVYIPSMLPFVLNNISVAINLGFKVAIMAEVLGQPSIGIGREMLISKLTLNSTQLFAWTIWIIVLGLLFDGIVSFVVTKLKDKFT